VSWVFFQFKNIVCTQTHTLHHTLTQLTANKREGERGREGGIEREERKRGSGWERREMGRRGRKMESEHERMSVKQCKREGKREQV
jgi:hypothetical protein